MPDKHTDYIVALGDALDYSTPDTSFSPFFSTVGLGFDDAPGIHALYLHYNRLTTTFGLPLLRFDGALVRRQQTALGVRQELEAGTVDIAFYDHNAWLVECQGVPHLDFNWNALKIAEQYTGLYFPFGMSGGSGWMSVPAEQWSAPPSSPLDDGARLFGAYLPTPDDRDPDRTFPFLLGLRVVRGRVAGDSGRERVRIEPDREGVIVVAFAAEALDVASGSVRSRLAAPPSVEEARARTATWFTSTLGGLGLEAVAPHERQLLHSAAHSLMLNMYRAPGLLDGRVAACPSRGGYPAHFLWDACFQNLAVALMRPGLAEDSLLLLTENTRADGKMPHFICSTWTRPNESQPPLVGWAGLKLIQGKHDLDLARQLLPVLQRNTTWWLANRITAYGLIGTSSGFETGWDNTPRLDQGPIVACDMNSYLLSQMRACEAMARLLGDEATATILAAQADDYAGRIVAVLYDERDGLFHDRLIETGAYLPLKTPAIFLPLWAGASPSETAARRMIETCLLNPATFFGRFPFPCVAYDESAYDPDEWWRGPVWLPIAYLMLETLDRYGYHAARQEAARRLYDMVLRDGQLCELFNSATGQGRGCRQQAWTAAIFLKLHQELTS